MKKNIFVIVCLWLISTSFLSSSVLAIMIGLSLEDLTRTSECVIKGEVKNVESYWSKDNKTIFTSASIDIEEIIKGKLLYKKIIVEYEGGEVNDIGLKVSDIAPLKRGEKIILFLENVKSMKNEGKDVFNIVGNAQGKYVIGDDGIARRSGFSTIKEKNDKNSNILVNDLINRVRRTK